jgi:hypothetical protein
MGFPNLVHSRRGAGQCTPMGHSERPLITCDLFISAAAPPSGLMDALQSDSQHS